MSKAFLGKFQLDVTVVGGQGPGAVHVHGHWAIYDLTISATDPIEQGQCPNERESLDDAINDATRFGEARMSDLHEADSAVQ
ncbi:hypothetical protein [Dyella tabacisoli]|uniref:Uncharacterized protein n=1 Tax=Dyella tabacisoli TaxID=2282381 RepID=A0A369UHH8_9GAMM|nr:hypothetical protein [Dyella tabacisoli]RDD80204.1 hypothetical protein DVJ77_18865 [Dyella tabacisoli]